MRLADRDQIRDPLPRLGRNDDHRRIDSDILLSRCVKLLLFDGTFFTFFFFYFSLNEISREQKMPKKL